MAHCARLRSTGRNASPICIDRLSTMPARTSIVPPNVSMRVAADWPASTWPMLAANVSNSVEPILANAEAARTPSDRKMVFSVAVFCSSDNPDNAFCNNCVISDMFFIEPSALKNAFCPETIVALTICNSLLSAADFSAYSAAVGSNAAILSWSFFTFFCALSISPAVMPENNPSCRMAFAASSESGTSLDNIAFSDVPASEPPANEGEIAAMVVLRSVNETPKVEATPPTAANAYW